MLASMLICNALRGCKSSCTRDEAGVPVIMIREDQPEQRTDIAQTAPSHRTGMVIRLRTASCTLISSYLRSVSGVTSSLICYNPRVCDARRI